MKLAAIYLPRINESGLPLTEKDARLFSGHLAIRDHLVSTYGGYTRYDATGAWAPDPGAKPVVEPVTVYDFAAPDRRSTDDDIRALASKVKTITDEKSVMIRLTNNTVEFI